MEKLGASLSSGHVLVNGTRKQVLLVGAPTRGRSRTYLTLSYGENVVTSGARQT